MAYLYAYITCVCSQACSVCFIVLIGTKSSIFLSPGAKPPGPGASNDAESLTLKTGTMLETALFDSFFEDSCITCRKYNLLKW